MTRFLICDVRTQNILVLCKTCPSIVPSRSVSPSHAPQQLTDLTFSSPDSSEQEEYRSTHYYREEQELTSD
ncbi:hypothetical protein AAFF_G00167810 [Aldrovandia affinis]|uniref:Uncharacterized protein n=1 Tax=Aldrovandia affinis TaxID=143900 RepID=A0AAD7RM95_9TELE|nr:hypothetical protein AAFF_G00167810 [Aldrovandia affinis]